MSAAFKSALAPDLARFLAFKKQLGFRYRNADSILASFDRFLAARGRAYAVSGLDRALLEWLDLRAQHRRRISLLYDCSVLRQFLAYLRRQYPRRLVPEPLWPRLPGASSFVPWIFSSRQIRLLLARASRLDRPVFRRHLYRMLILVLYCAGLRLGEALRLRLRDLDVRGSVLFITESKGRSRWVPIHPTLSRELERYLVHRLGLGWTGPDDFLLVQRHRPILPPRTADGCLQTLLRRAGLKPASGRGGPRPHDLRHTFAVHRLTRWYRQGVDPQARLLWLSAYLGHSSILGTERYLTATPDLLALAGHRFRERLLSTRRRP